MDTYHSENPNIVKRASLRLTRIVKRMFQRVCYMPNRKKQILFILGCQRSGTSIMTRIFERDLNAKIFGEYSELSVETDDKLRLKPYAAVKKCIDSQVAPFIISKPLVESQNALVLLDYFRNSKIIWMHRYYKDVALSNVEKFGNENCIANLKPIVEQDKFNWRSEYVQTELIKFVKQFYHIEMNPFDAAALFWLVRNSIYFGKELNVNPRVLAVDYNDIVSSPLDTLQIIYKFAGRPSPSARIVNEVHCKSKNRGTGLYISEEIERSCEEMWKKMKA